MTTPRALELLAIDSRSVPHELLLQLRVALHEFLQLPVEIAPPLELPRPEPETASERLSSNELVDRLVERSGKPKVAPTGWVLGITGQEIAAPGRTFVFGEATLAGAWAVVSTARLSKDARPDELLARLRKEALHELGHLGGLGHCSDSRCLMYAVESVAEVDQKNSEFCVDCHTRFFGG